MLNEQKKFKPPFSEPQNYVGLPLKEAESKTGAIANKGKNIVIDSNDFHLLLESNDDKITYAEVSIKGTEESFYNQNSKSGEILNNSGIDTSKLELQRKSENFHVYYNHEKKLKITVSKEDNLPLSISISNTYYLD